MLNDLKEYILDNNLGDLRFDESMIHHTYVKTGGRVELLYLPNSINALASTFKFICDNNINYYTVGRGSNILVADKLAPMVIIKLSGVLDECNITDNIVEVGTGFSLQLLSRNVSKLGLEGLEFAGGIPATIGGAIYMNAGAHSGSMDMVVKEVTAITETGEIVTLSNKQCNFSYRHSLFQENKYLIIHAILELKQGDRAQVFKRMSGNLEYRKEMQPLDKPSFGSVFRNPIGAHAGRLIEEAGLKGYQIGGAQISDKHANFIINVDVATTEDIINLIELAKSRVYAESGYQLETEVRIVE